MVLMALNAILGFEMLSSFCHLTPPSVCVTRVTPLEPCNRLYRRLFSGSASSNEIGRISRTAMHIEEFDIWYIFKSVTRDSSAHSWHHVSRVTLENVKFLGENDYKRNTWYMYSSRGLRDSKARHCIIGITKLQSRHLLYWRPFYASSKNVRSFQEENIEEFDTWLFQLYSILELLTH